MGGYILWVFLLALWNTILFFSRDYGLNVILFNIPLMIFMYYLLKKNNKINNKKGLLLIIPVILLSLTYVLFNNFLFSVLNFLAIPILIVLMVMYTVNPTFRIRSIFKNIIYLFFVPFKYIARFYRVSTSKLKEKFHASDKVMKVIKMLLIVIPITLIIVALLSSADMVFDNLFDNFFGSIFKFLKLEFFDRLLGRIFVFIILFFIIGCTSMYIIYEYKNDEEVIVSKEKNRDLFTIKALLCVLNVIYIIFDFIQIKSLLLHSVSSNINYAEYARSGFFELLVVSIINLTVILFIRRYENKNNHKEFNFVKIMSVLMIFLTVIIIASSFLRMHMYESEFGYTVLRLLIFAFLITEAVLMIPTVMYIFNRNVNIVRSYLIIFICSYLVLNFMNIDYLIARRNVNRYYSVKDIDLDYLENFGTDNIPVLIELYNKTDDAEIKLRLNDYLFIMKNTKSRDAFEFNLSNYRANKKLNEIHLEPNYGDYLDIK